MFRPLLAYIQILDVCLYYTRRSEWKCVRWQIPHDVHDVHDAHILSETMRAPSFLFVFFSSFFLLSSRPDKCIHLYLNREMRSYFSRFDYFFFFIFFSFLLRHPAPPPPLPPPAAAGSQRPVRTHAAAPS